MQSYYSSDISSEYSYQNVISRSEIFFSGSGFWWILRIVQYCSQFWKWILRMGQGSVKPDLVHPEDPLPELGAISSILRVHQSPLPKEIFIDIFRLITIFETILIRCHDLITRSTNNMLVTILTRYIISTKKQ